MSIDEAVKKAQASTRQFAKRQITWHRSTTNVISVDSNSESIFEIIAPEIQK